jgi:hypothetical protein
MSLDFVLKKTQPTVVFDANITHNLTRMADAAGIYWCLWRPDEIGITKAHQMIPLLTEGLQKLIEDPETFRQYDAANGWGKYENFVPFVKRVLTGCIEHPDADVETCR